MEWIPAERTGERNLDAMVVGGDGKVRKENLMVDV